MMTLGKAVTDYIDRLGEDGDASSALILNAMADSCLFSFEEELQQALRSFCREKNCGISRRYEIGTDLPLLWQQRAYDGLAAGRTLGLKMTADYMLVPEKSMSLAFLVSTDPAVFHAGHDCRMCHHTNCCLRQQPYGESQSSDSPAFQEYTCPSGQIWLIPAWAGRASGSVRWKRHVRPLWHPARRRNTACYEGRPGVLYGTGTERRLAPGLPGCSR